MSESDRGIANTDADRFNAEPQTVSTPLVSVLLCVFNGGRFLNEAVTGILNQTYANFELVIINDGSTDFALESIREIKDSRIRIIDKENTGLTHSLNIGIAHCRGEFIARQDADDVSCVDRLEAQVGYLKSHPEVKAIGSAVSLMDDDGDKIGGLDFPCDHESIRARLVGENQFVHGALMFRRSSLDEIDGYREIFIYAQDYDLMLRMSDIATVNNLPGRHYCLRFGSSRISIDHGQEQRGFANLARAMARQRENGQVDDIARGEFLGDLSPYLDHETTANQAEVLLYLYCRSDYKSKIRHSVKVLLQDSPGFKQAAKYSVIYLLSLLPGNWVRWIYQSVDKVSASQQGPLGK